MLRSLFGGEQVFRIELLRGGIGLLNPAFSPIGVFMAKGKAFYRLGLGEFPVFALFLPVTGPGDGEGFFQERCSGIAGYSGFFRRICG